MISVEEYLVNMLDLKKIDLSFIDSKIKLRGTEKVDSVD